MQEKDPNKNSNTIHINPIIDRQTDRQIVGQRQRERQRQREKEEAGQGERTLTLFASGGDHH